MFFDLIRACRRFLGRVTGREAKRLKKRIGALRVELATQQESATHLAEYSTLLPLAENALGMFPGAWSSSLPNAVGPGTVPLFEDHRITWLTENLGDIAGWRILELGPLEGGHTYMLEQAGAKVTAIEGNHDSFLRCLITKNYLGMNSEFVLGDFAKSFGGAKDLDLVVASGVLYHMTQPVDLLQKIAAVSSRLFLWTHYYHPDISLWNKDVRSQVGTKWRPDLMETIRVGELDVRIVPQSSIEGNAGNRKRRKVSV